MANLDQVVVVQSVAEPAPQKGLVDRLLLAAERYGVPGLLCLNKVDLDPAAARDPRWSYYGGLGYDLLRTSAVDGSGCAELAQRLSKRVSLLLGASGVGKSSLLNVIEPGLDLRVGDVTEKTGLGRHTTTRTELFPLSGGGFIADSPGLRGFDLWGVDPLELRDYFPDFRSAGEGCRFRSCLHRDEPDCGVKEEVVHGTIPTWRHAIYLALLEDIEARAADGEGRRA
jgi:ribosome biogenesis GTPase